MSDFLPTASIQTLQQRAELIALMRSIFNDHGYFEVETPILSTDIVLDAWLEPFVTDYLSDPQRWPSGGQPRYLQTSPEAHMKRLLAAGATAIFQFSRVFRNGEHGRRHNPEFTMLEWYRVGDDHHRQMDFVEHLVRKVLMHDVRRDPVRRGSPDPADSTDRRSPLPQHDDVDDGSKRRPSVQDSAGSGDPRRTSVPFERLTYDDAFARYAGQRVLTLPTSELPALCERHRLWPPESLAGDDRDGWLNFLLAALIEPNLGQDRPTFLYDYPASQAALARVTERNGTHVAERFELYLDGVELCNGYHELTDADALRQRTEQQTVLRESAGLRLLPGPARLMEAMRAGFPSCSGVALGVDRLIMLALGTTSIAEVIAFPFDRA